MDNVTIVGMGVASASSASWVAWISAANGVVVADEPLVEMFGCGVLLATRRVAGIVTAVSGVGVQAAITNQSEKIRLSKIGRLLILASVYGNR